MENLLMYTCAKTVLTDKVLTKLLQKYNGAFLPQIGSTWCMAGVVVARWSPLTKLTYVGPG